MEEKTYPLYRTHWVSRRWFHYAIIFFFTSLISTILPAFILWGGGFWFYLDSVRVNTTLGVFISCIAAGASIIRFMCHPGVDALYNIIKKVLIIYSLLLAFLVFTRLEYSRAIIIMSFVFFSLSCFVIFWISAKYCKAIYGIIPVGSFNKLKEVDTINWVVLNNPASFLDSLHCDGVVVDFKALESHDTWQRFLAGCTLLKIPVYHSKQVYESLTGRVSIEHLHENDFGTTLAPLPFSCFKRLFDVTVILILLPFIFPVIFLTSIFIVVESSGPIFFVQKRVGCDNKDFFIYKFRSMYCDSELNGMQFAKVQDYRVTRVGRFIRKYRIDELPQFLNVIKGDMSLIGPRPEQRFFVEKFESELPFYIYRHMIRPGISGWAQVMHGYSGDVESTRTKLEYDFYYIKNFSFWLDLLILFKTVRTVFTGFGAR
ncbi:sugar transferase [Aeromonas caviae]|uniref:sugar transferase n=1 Tax=Aeromonas caviae TaxID=648 RepID=UPI00244B1D58|nr:sugar transferase [Aeromonas caviae]MDH0318261.1 sugar transferase [Aeromonas caviae]